MNKLIIPNGTTCITNIRVSDSYRLKNTFMLDIDKYFDVEEIYMPDSVIIIGPYAFENLKNLKFIRLSNNLRLVGSGAFRNCNSLREIYIPNTLLKFESPFIGSKGGLILFGGEWLNFQLAQGMTGKHTDNVYIKTNISPNASYSKYKEFPKDEASNVFEETLKTEHPDISFNKYLYNDTIEALRLVERQLDFSKFKNIINLNIDELKKELEETEKVEEVTSNLKNYEDLSWENIYEDSKETEGVYASTPEQGLVLSLRNKGKVDIEYIASITGLEMKEIIKRLKGTIYQDPMYFDEKYYKGWKMSDEYLSGNLKKKLDEAKEANKKYLGVFEDNIQALLSIMPEAVSSSDIYFNLSSSWIPENVIKDYICNLLNITSQKYYEKNVSHTNGTWRIKSLASTYTPWAVTNKFSTKQISITKMLEKVLNLSDISCYDRVDVDGFKTKKSVLNKGNTILAMEKAEALNQDFIDYCKERKEVFDIITDTYNEKYSTYVTRKFNGDFLEFANLNPDVKLFDYQRNAVARIILSLNNVLLAHDVGTGKTFIIAAAIMEMRRMKTSLKNMIVVPNNIISQWAQIFRYLYKDVKLKVVEPKHFTKEKKNETLRDIKDNDYDAIIIGKSSFALIKSSVDEEIKNLEAELNALLQETKPNQKRVKKLTSDLNKLYEYKNSGDVLFNELGINSLFVDEAHTYKNVSLTTPSGSYALNKEGSDECDQMLKKVRIVKEIPTNKVVFATGTPITNSISDCYVMQKFLQEGELRLLDINNFGDWMSTYAERKDELEIDVDTTQFRVKTRFSRFHNLPQLTTIFANIADFYQLEEIKDLPKFNGYTDIVIPKTMEFGEFLKEISTRADTVRHHRVDVKTDNLLKITTDGRKAALDLRLIDYDKYKDYKSGKIYACAKCVSEIYYRTMSKLSTQLVFMDTSISQDKFNLYDELKRTLVLNYGIPSDKVAFVSDATTEKERTKLFTKVNKGEIRVLIGSTQRLGTGVNVQDKLIAIHHVDVPWRPADMVQREGRIIRQGNTNEEVFIYRYVQENSFDAYSWQILETKQEFINNILSNSLNERVKDDIEEVALDYAQIKALAIGDPKIKERANLQNELNRNILLQKRYKDSYTNQQKLLLDLPHQIKEKSLYRDTLLKDVALFEANKREYTTDERFALRDIISAALKDNILKKEETYLINYQGFDVYLPPRMISTDEYLIIKGDGKYTVKLNKEAGIVPKLDNFFESMKDRYFRASDEVDALEAKKLDIEYNLANKVDYSGIIEGLTMKIEELDKELKINA